MGHHPLRTRFPRITPCANWTPSRSLGVFWRSSQPWHIAGSRNLYHVFSMAHMSASRAAGPLFGARARTDVRAREAMIYARSCCILDWTRCYTGFTSALLHSFSASCPAQVAIDRWCTCLTLDLLAGWQRRRADGALMRNWQIATFATRESRRAREGRGVAHGVAFSRFTN